MVNLTCKNRPPPPHNSNLRDFDPPPPVKNRYNRMNFTFSENYVFLMQFWIGATFFDHFSAENYIFA